MPVFVPGPEVWSRRDLSLLQNGAVHRYWRRSALEADIVALEALGWAAVRLDATGWSGRSDIHGPIAAALSFPDHYGRNLDALNDCLGDVAMRDYGFPEDAEGLVLVFDGLDALLAGDAAAAHALLDIVADRARFALLFGNRMLGLVRTDDPAWDLPPVGGLSVLWNGAESAGDRHTAGADDDGP